MFLDEGSADGTARTAAVNQCRGGNAGPRACRLDHYIGCQGFIVSAQSADIVSGLSEFVQLF